MTTFRLRLSLLNEYVQMLITNFDLEKCLPFYVILLYLQWYSDYKVVHSRIVWFEKCLENVVLVTYLR